MQVSFQANIPQKISELYKTKQSMSNTVAILGGSKATADVMDYMNICSSSVKSMILNGKNIVHGCCTTGIMGAALAAGKEYSKKDEEGNPVQNMAIIMNPRWGDEDLESCFPIGETNSEAERIKTFTEVADSILIFPGGAGTLLEASTLIFNNYYGKDEEKRKIILVGREFFKGLKEQYDKFYETGMIRCKPEELFTIVDNEKEINECLYLTSKRDIV